MSATPDDLNFHWLTVSLSDLNNSMQASDSTGNHPPWLIKAQHSAGQRCEWNVTEADLHISDNTARIADIKNASPSIRNQKSLESAFLQKQAAAEFRIGYAE